MQSKGQRKREKIYSKAKHLCHSFEMKNPLSKQLRFVYHAVHWTIISKIHIPDIKNKQTNKNAWLSMKGSTTLYKDALKGRCWLRSV